jgi:probable rRNA maturation factor
VRGEERQHRTLVEIANKQRRVPIDVRIYQRLLSALLVVTRRTSSVVGLTFISDRQMRQLNRRFRGIDRTTDVLAFPVPACLLPWQAHVRGRSDSSLLDNPHRDTVPLVHTPKHAPVHTLGDIVISIDTARRQAREAGAALQDECGRLLIHGYLHLLGYDHERSRPEAVRMRRLERRLERRLKESPKNRLKSRPKNLVPGAPTPA